MFASRILSLLLGSMLLLVPLLTDGTSNDPGSYGRATSTELASVRGMDFQQPADPTPITLLGRCCKAGGGSTTCTYSIPFSNCGGGLIVLGQTCGTAENLHCHRITNGPSKFDACTTAGAEPTNSCTMNHDGWCVKANVGTCTTTGLGMAYCACLNTSPQTYGSRDYCTGNSCP